MDACSECGAALETPLACERCGALCAVADDTSPFEVFGVSPGFVIDPGQLKKRLLELTRLTHPDFHGISGEDAQGRAEVNTAMINSAYAVLANEWKRADCLITALSGPSEQEEREMPQAFLLEVLEWNEALEDARQATPDSSARGHLEELAAELSARREESISQVAGHLTPLPASGDPILTETRRTLNAIRYLDRALRELRDIA